MHFGTFTPAFLVTNWQIKRLHASAANLILWLSVGFLAATELRVSCTCSEFCVSNLQRITGHSDATYRSKDFLYLYIVDVEYTKSPSTAEVCRGFLIHYVNVLSILRKRANSISLGSISPNSPHYHGCNVFCSKARCLFWAFFGRSRHQYSLYSRPIKIKSSVIIICLTTKNIH